MDLFPEHGVAVNWDKNLNKHFRRKHLAQTNLDYRFCLAATVLIGYSDTYYIGHLLDRT
jgi:hypothetical protein